MFSEFGPNTVSNVMKLWSSDVIRYILVLANPGFCGHNIGSECISYNTNSLFCWDNQQDFFAYNYSNRPRILLLIDIWK